MQVMIIPNNPLSKIILYFNITSRSYSLLNFEVGFINKVGHYLPASLSINKISTSERYLPLVLIYFYFFTCLHPFQNHRMQNYYH